jgi:predicted nucleic acid-binding protein
MTVVSNTSPLLNLALIERLQLVEAQFGAVVVPTAVWDELTAGFDGRDRIEAFRDRGGIRVVSPEPTELRTEFERDPRERARRVSVGPVATVTERSERTVATGT